MRFRSIIISCVASALLAARAIGSELINFHSADETKLVATTWDTAFVEPRIEAPPAVRVSVQNIALGYRDPVLQATGTFTRGPRAAAVAPYRPIGVTGAKRLHELIHKPYDPPQHIRLDCNLRLGETISPPLPFHASRPTTPSPTGKSLVRDLTTPNKTASAQTWRVF